MTLNTGPPTAKQMQYVEGLYRKYRALMYKHARGTDRSQDEADDIVSESLRRLFLYTDKLMACDELQRLNYIVKTIRSVVSDYYRKRNAYERHITPYEEHDAAGPGPEELYIERESRDTLVRHLYETLNEVSDTDRLVLVGKYMQGASDEVLARQLGVKASSIRMMLTRARKNARVILERKEADDGAKNSR